MLCRKTFNRIPALAAAALLAGAAQSALADFDVSPGAAGGHIVTGAFEDATSTFVSSVRVFHYALGEDSPFFTQDPGFHPIPGSGLPEGTAITVSIGSPLTYWNGAGAVSFGSLPSGETLKLQKGTPFLTVGSSAPAGTLSVGTIDASGEFDEHLEATLFGGGGDPANGIYLTSLILHGSTPEAGDSNPLYLIYNNGLDDQAEALATIAVRDAFAPGSNLADVPEPTGLAAIGVLAGAILYRRRRSS